MIRTVALGVVCLAGLGAIAAAAKKPSLPQPAEIVFPKVAGSKADRLPLIPRLGTPTDVERVDVAYVPPVEAPSNQQHHKRQRVRHFLVSFLGVGTIHMTGSSSRGPSKEPVNQSRQRKAPPTGCPNALLT